MTLRETIARALAEADGKDPDARAWAVLPGGRVHPEGVCWRDQYGRKADAILSLPEIVKITETLEKCRDKFDLYEQLHRLKCTAEGDEKADRNREMTVLCDEALSLLKESDHVQ